MLNYIIKYYMILVFLKILIYYNINFDVMIQEQGLYDVLYMNNYVYQLSLRKIGIQYFSIFDNCYKILYVFNVIFMFDSYSFMNIKFKVQNNMYCLF